MRLLREDVHLSGGQSLEVQDRETIRISVFLQLELHPGVQEEKMTITKCDRCGAQINGVMLIKLRAGYGEPLRGINMDLCDNCMKDLRRWIHETGAEDQAEN